MSDSIEEPARKSGLGRAVAVGLLAAFGGFALAHGYLAAGRLHGWNECRVSHPELSPSERWGASESRSPDTRSSAERLPGSSASRSRSSVPA